MPPKKYMQMKSKNRPSPWAWVPTLYFMEGVPYFIVNSVSVALFTQLGMPLGKMSLFTSLISFPWIVKPLWSPFVDVIRTKRWWVLLMQFFMVVCVALLALLAPKGYFTLALIFFTLTAFASATHDIAADGFYMIALDEKRQSAFVGIRSTFYKIANIFCQSILLVLVGALQEGITIGGWSIRTSVSRSWVIVLLGCSALLALISLWHAFALPKVEQENSERKTAKEVWGEIGVTLLSFFRKPGIGLAIAFMLIYRLPEALLLKLCVPFFLSPMEKGGLGLTIEQVGQFYGGFGVVMMLLGGIIGGLAGSRLGLKKVMLWMCLCLTLPCAVYCYMAICQPLSHSIIIACIGVEQFGYGLGYTACMLYMMYFANGEHKTSHFSLCTAFMFLGLMLPGLIAGWLQEKMGYIDFFWLVMVCCIPSIIITVVVQRSLPQSDK